MTWIVAVAMYVPFVVLDYGILYGEESWLEPPSGLRRIRGLCLLVALLLGVLGPIGTLIVWCTTGFAENGWKIR